MNKSVVRDFLVGLTFIFGVGGLLIMFMLFGEFRKRFEKVYPIKLAMPSGAGVGSTSPVLFNGVRVGAVTGLAVANPPTDGIIATLKIDRGIHIPRDLSVYIEKGFVGDSAMALSFAPGADPNKFIPEDAFLPGSNTPPIRVEPRSLFGDLARPLERLSSTAEKFEKFAETYTRVGESLQALLEPRKPGDVDAGKPPTVASILARMDTILAGVNKWVGDDALYNSLKNNSDKIGQLLTDAQAAAKSIDNAAQSLDSKGERAVAAVENLGRDAKTTLSRLDGALTDVGAIAGKINRGEGTAGQLVNNPDLYRSLNSAADRLDRALTDLQLLLQKFKAEGIKVGL
ncbi:MAG: MlaD family protein [Phycisphaerales bacterium]